MLYTVDEFRARVRQDMPGLVQDLQEQTSRHGASERDAWTASLPIVAAALSHPSLESLHLALRERKSLSLEYRLPGAGSWCDVVLLGRGTTRPGAVILELKDWDVSGISPGPRAGLINHRGEWRLHPSEQVRGYVEYCRYFHSAVIREQGDVAGCTLLTSARSTGSLEEAPHDQLVATYPVFHAGEEDLRDRVASYVTQRLTSGDEDWAEAFEHGRYEQDRSFVKTIAMAMARDDQGHLVLLDGQRKGFEHCLAEIDSLIADAPDEKMAIIIEGPPGSGKSVLAAKLWAALSKDDRLPGDKVIVATSTVQRSNWNALVVKMSGERASRGIVKKTADFNPGIGTSWVKKQRALGERVEIEDWRQNMLLALRKGIVPRLHNNSIGLSVVDEAHALIDPTAPGKNGIPPSGWTHHAGPQAYHVMRASRISIFLLDPEQSYRDNETTSPETIRTLAKTVGVTRTTTISLEDSQFRCGGSTEYVQWVDRMLEGLPTPPGALPDKWRDTNAARRFRFEIVRDPAALDERLREHLAEGRTARLAASYARPWKTQKVGARPHQLPVDQQDFEIRYVRGGERRTWSRIWNYLPGGDYECFIQAPNGSAIRGDSLCEVGCPYVMRGFDFDYIGLLWLSDYVWRNDRWVAQLDHIHESALKLTKSRAKAALQPKRPRGKPAPKPRPDDPWVHSLLAQLRRGYRILLTRAIRGVYVWCEDDETREYLASRLAPNDAPT